MKHPKTGVELKKIKESPSGCYRAGADGNIYSQAQKRGKWIVLAGHDNKRGYLVIALCSKNERATRKVHRLICSAFHGQPTKAKPEVRHMDGDCQNNLPGNLKWGTRWENMQDKKTHGTTGGVKGGDNSQARFGHLEREHIRWCIKMGLCSRAQISRVLGAEKKMISRIAKEPVKKWVAA